MDAVARLIFVCTVECWAPPCNPVPIGYDLLRFTELCTYIRIVFCWCPLLPLVIYHDQLWSDWVSSLLVTSSLRSMVGCLLCMSNLVGVTCFRSIAQCGLACNGVYCFNFVQLAPIWSKCCLSSLWWYRKGDPSSIIFFAWRPMHFLLRLHQCSWLTSDKIIPRIDFQTWQWCHIRGKYFSLSLDPF